MKKVYRIECAIEGFVVGIYTSRQNVAKKAQMILKNESKEFCDFVVTTSKIIGFRADETHETLYNIYETELDTF